MRLRVQERCLLCISVDECSDPQVVVAISMRTQISPIRSGATVLNSICLWLKCCIVLLLDIFASHLGLKLVKLRGLCIICPLLEVHDLFLKQTSMQHCHSSCIMGKELSGPAD